MLSADRIVQKALRPGLKQIEPLLQGNIVTLRSADKRWLFELVINIIVRSHEEGEKALYLHWVDYHKRFWTLDYDFIMRVAKRENKKISDEVFFQRAFSRDNNEVEKNWDDLNKSGKYDLIVLDSISELYEESRKRGSGASFGGAGYRGAGRGAGFFGGYGGNGSPRAGGELNGQNLPMTYSIGKFAQLCIRNACPGIILDYSKRLHPYLGHISSVVLDIETTLDEITFNLQKHPSLPDHILRLPRRGQYTLRRWI